MLNKNKSLSPINSTVTEIVRNYHFFDYDNIEILDAEGGWETHLNLQLLRINKKIIQN